MEDLNFRLAFASGLAYRRGTMARVVTPIILNGVRYRVLRLDDAGCLRFLLRSESGELFGVYGRNAQAALSAAPLMLKFTADNPFKGIDFFEIEGGGLKLREP